MLTIREHAEESTEKEKNPFAQQGRQRDVKFEASLVVNCNYQGGIHFIRNIFLHDLASFQTMDDGVKFFL